MIQKSQWNKGGLSAKLYTLVVGNVVRLAKNAEENADNRGDFEYKETLRRISALGWSTDLRQLPGLNFIQLYDYLFVSTSKYRHIVLKDTNYKKLKSYQFFFQGNVERLESKVYQGKTYVKATLLPSMKKNSYRVIVEFSRQCDIASGVNVSGRAWRKWRR